MREYISFVALILGILLTFFISWYGLRQYGLGRPVSQYQTPLVAQLMQSAQSQTPVWSTDDPRFPLVRLIFRQDQWVVQTPTGDQPLSSHLSKDTPARLLFFEAQSPLALPKLRELVKQTGAWKTSIFCSSMDGLLKDLRELEPQWTFCSGEAYLVRLLAFSSLGLESLLEMTSDVIMIHAKTNLARKNVLRIIDEAKRQNKFVIMGPVARPSDGYQPHGWMVEIADPKVQ